MSIPPPKKIKTFSDSVMTVTAAVASVRDGRVAAVILLLEWLLAAALAVPGALRRGRRADRGDAEATPAAGPSSTVTA